MKYIRKELVSVVLITSIFVTTSSPVFSQSPTPRISPRPTSPPLAAPTGQPSTGVDLALSPTFLSLNTDPGETVNAQFKITNNNNFREYLKINVAKFTASSDGGSPVIADIEEGDEFATWISFSEKEFTVDPREAKTIRVTLNPPEDAALGYYYALVVSRVNTSVADSNQQAVIAGSPALSVLLNVKSPNAKRELQILDFTTDSMFSEFLPTSFSVVVENTGNIHAVPVGDIFIDWGGKKDIAVLQANKGKGNVLPQTTRTFTASWEDGFAVRIPKVTDDGKAVLDDKGKPEYEIKYDFTKADKFRIGKYTANLLLVYDNGERDVPVEATVSFWVIPVRLILGTIAIILLPALLVFLLMRWRYGKKR